MWFSKIDKFACQGAKVTFDNIENLITEKWMLKFFSFFTKIFCLTFSTLTKFGFETAVGLRVVYETHHLRVILALLMLLKRPYIKQGKSLY